MDYSQILSQQFNIKEEYAKNIITLLDDGNTIPFIARYRKEMHGSMDDQLIREFAEKLEYLRGLDKRRDEIRSLIDAQEKLTDEINLALDKLRTKFRYQIVTEKTTSNYCNDFHANSLICALLSHFCLLIIQLITFPL